MSRQHLTAIATELGMLATSGAFLAWYLLAKVAVWPWGSYRL